MNESVTYMQQLHIPKHVAPYQYGEVDALVAMKCDVGGGEFDGPCDVALKALLRLPILEWECLNVTIDSLAKCIVLEDVRIVFPNYAAECEEHLVRYLVNINERTGQGWKVLERYHTTGPDHGRDHDGYDRALLRAKNGSTLRVFYRRHSRCWVKGQPILKSWEAANASEEEAAD